jgi:uncharacterized protein (UPF0371 family)
MINTTHNDKIKSIINKYGIEQSLDIIVGGKDTIRQIYQDNILEFLNQFNDLTKVEEDGRIYYVDKDRSALFFYNQTKKDGYAYIHYYKIWLFFSDVIVIKSEEIQSIIKNWLKQTYNINGLTPCLSHGVMYIQLE